MKKQIFNTAGHNLKQCLYEYHLIMVKLPKGCFSHVACVAWFLLISSYQVSILKGTFPKILRGSVTKEFFQGQAHANQFPCVAHQTAAHF